MQEKFPTKKFPKTSCAKCYLGLSNNLHRFVKLILSAYSMAATPSVMIPLGTIAPAFILPDTVSGNRIVFSPTQTVELGVPATVIMFICNHCPFVKHIQHAIVRTTNYYIPRKVRFLAISSNDVSKYPDDAPHKMHEEALQAGYTFPYLFDESQEVAKAYQAACTPDFYVFDGQSRCIYRGQFDDSRPSNTIPPNGADVRAAIDAVLAGNPVNPHQKPSIGCNIKWKDS